MNIKLIIGEKTKHAADINLICRQDSNGIGRYELGRMYQICVHCEAKFWMEESDQCSSITSPSFSVCYADGKVRLPPLLRPPPYLINLYTSPES